MNHALNLRYSGIDTISLISQEFSSVLISESKASMKLDSARSLHILLADDDEDDLDLFREVMAEAVPCAVLDSVSNGAALIDMLTATDAILPDMIFLDLNMPCMNGKECLREIKGNILLQNIPVVIYSTSSNYREIENAYNAGANYYVTKPNTFGDLKKIIKKIFSMDRANFNVKCKRERFVLK